MDINDNNELTMENEVQEEPTDEKILGRLIRERVKGKNGKFYWNYIYYTNIRNVDKKIEFAPRDVGGYEVLDIVFDDGSHPVDLILKELFMIDENKIKRSFNQYIARSYDDDGLVYECKLRPKLDSDKNMINMKLNNDKILEARNEK